MGAPLLDLPKSFSIGISSRLEEIFTLIDDHTIMNAIENFFRYALRVVSNTACAMAKYLKTLSQSFLQNRHCRTKNSQYGGVNAQEFLVYDVVFMKCDLPFLIVMNCAQDPPPITAPHLTIGNKNLDYKLLSLH